MSVAGVEPQETMSKPLTFKELAEGSHFISFPQDGDDSGHGGFRKGAYLFTKLRMSKGKDGENCVRCCDGQLSQATPNMQVFLVL
jgi:hypothetical protein